MRFSDIEYSLPQIEALRAGHILMTGTTLPMILEGVDRVTGERGQFVVKFKNANRMSLTSSARELIAAWIAYSCLDCFGIRTSSSRTFHHSY